MNGGTNNTNVPSNTNNSYSSLVSQLAATTTSTNGQVTFLCAGILSNLSVTASGLPGAGNEYDIQLLVNGSGSGTLDCTITNAGLSCSDTGTMDVDPGDEINVEINPNSDPTLQNFDWSADVDPPAAIYP